MRTVTRLSIAPVKSLGLRHPSAIRIEPFGVLENRRFHLIDERGALFGGTKHGPLVQIASEWDSGSERLALRFPDGTVVEGPADGLGAAVRTVFYGRPVEGRLVEGPFSDALSAHAGLPLLLVRPDHPGEANDVWPLSLVSSASVTALARSAGREDLDPRRFRMLIEIDGCTAYEEDGWDGRAVRVGGAVLRIAGPIPRCQVTQLDPSTGLRDFPTLSAIKSARGLGPDGRSLPFGIYGEVLEPGLVRVGDPVEPLDGAAPPAR